MKLLQRFNPDFDDPLFRPIDADDFRTNHEAASDFSNLRQNGLVRVVLPFPLNGKVKLVDPAGAVSNETEVDVWRMVPTVNDVKLTGNDLQNPWFRNPNPTGGYQLDARFATLQEQAKGRSWHTLKSRIPPPTRCSTIWRHSSACCSRTAGSALCQTPLTKGPCPCRIPIRGSTSSNNREKLFSNGRRRSARGSGPVDVADDTRSGRSLSRHPDAVPATSRSNGSARGSPSSRAPNASTGTRRPTRSRCLWPFQVLRADRRQGHRSAQELRSGPGASHGVRRRRAAVRRLEQARRPWASRAQEHGAVLPQQQRRYARRGRRPLHEVFKFIKIGRRRPASSGPARRLDRRRQVRSPAGAGGTRRAARVSQKAVEAPAIKLRRHPATRREMRGVRSSRRSGPTQSRYEVVGSQSSTNLKYQRAR